MKEEKPIFVLYKKRSDSIEALSSTEYEEVERSTDKPELESKAVVLNNEHPAWLYFVGVPK